jgi:hypothetical protein
MLYPLAEVGIGMFVPIVVSRRQLVMDILRHGKWRNGKQKEGQADRQATTERPRRITSGTAWNH